MNRSISPKKLAQAIGASESSVKRWCDSGAIATTYTPGGHRKIDINEAFQFLRSSNYELTAPEQLGLPKTVGKQVWSTEKAVDEMFNALSSRREEVAVSMVMDLYLSDRSLASIFDEILAVVFERIGDDWECGKLDVYNERQACQICRRVIEQLRQVTRVSSARFNAIGGTLSGDYYELPTLMVEAVLRDHGWNAMSIGTNLPASAMIMAAEEQAPDLIWISVSHVADRGELIESINQLWEKLADNAPLVVGGRALSSEVRREIRYTVHCDTVTQLEDFLKSYQRNKPTAADSEPSLN